MKHTVESSQGGVASNTAVGKLEKDYKYVSVVAIGNFNPAIFQPEWFRAQEILPDLELETPIQNPGSLLVASDACMIKFRSLQLDVFHERWSLATERPDWFSDLGSVTRSIFDKLRHTPVTRVGINVVEHVGLESGRLDQVLESWLPHAHFGAVLGDEARVGAVGRAKWRDFKVSVTMQDSALLSGGLYLSQNYEAEVKSVQELSTILETTWSDILDRSKSVNTRLSKPREESSS